MEGLRAMLSIQPQRAGKWGNKIMRLIGQGLAYKHDTKKCIVFSWHGPSISSDVDIE